MTNTLKVAVVGHTNTGKTSLMRTLSRDTDFGEVSDQPAVTRNVQQAVLLVDGQPMIELYDTPGLEDSISLLQHIEAGRSDRRTDDIELIEHLLTSDVARHEYAQEAKALRQVLDSDVALYVIDARDRVLGKHRDELKILSMCARPVVPVLNFVARPESLTSQWREHLSRLSLHAVAEFDTVVLDEHGEQRLFEKMRSLLDHHRATFDALIADRKQQRAQLIRTSLELLADGLIDVAAYRLTVPAEDQASIERATHTLKETVRQREQRMVEQLLELHRFHPDDCDPDDLPISQGKWGLDLFSPDALKQFGIRAGSAAAAGAMAGLAVDVMAGGTTLGVAAATGAALGALASAGKSHGRRLMDRLRGKRELRCDDATLLLLQTRQLALLHALLTRGHAAQDKLRMASDHPSKPGKQANQRLAPPLRLARANPAWSSLNDRKAPASTARDTAQHQLADALEAAYPAPAPAT